MARRYFVCTGSDESKLPIGIEVEADVITIETSGALTLWKQESSARATLLMGFGPLHWQTIHVIPAAAENQSQD